MVSPACLRNGGARGDPGASGLLCAVQLAPFSWRHAHGWGLSSRMGGGWGRQEVVARALPLCDVVVAWSWGYRAPSSRPVILPAAWLVPVLRRASSGSPQPSRLAPRRGLCPHLLPSGASRGGWDRGRGCRAWTHGGV